MVFTTTDENPPGLFSRQYHRVLNRAVWSSLEGSRLLLVLLVSILAPAGPLIMGLDETLERRRGAKIQAKGIDRDPVRSSHSHMVKASGLRWLSLMFLVPIPWAERVWALPFLTVLAPSERYHQERGQRHQKLTDWARQMFLVVRRWLPARALVAVTDRSFAVISLLWRIRHLPNPICSITRLRLDAALYEPAPPRKPRQTGRPRLKGKRLPTLAQVLRDAATCWTTVTVRGWYSEGEREVEITSATGVWYHIGMPPLPIRWVLVRAPQGKFEPQALLSTDLTVDPVQILEWFVLRWRLEVTWQEARAHLGMETQRQWNERAIARTTPALLGLFSLVTLLAGRLAQEHMLPVRQAVWSHKSLPTFADAIAIVRQHLWTSTHFYMSPTKADMVEIPCSLLKQADNWRQQEFCGTCNRSVVSVAGFPRAASKSDHRRLAHWLCHPERSEGSRFPARCFAYGSA
jgi:hypothetical protein